MGLTAAVAIVATLAVLDAATAMLVFALAMIGLEDLIVALAAGLTIETGVAFFAEDLAAAGAAFLVFEDFDLTGILLLLNEYDERRD